MGAPQPLALILLMFWRTCLKLLLLTLAFSLRRAGEDLTTIGQLYGAGIGQLGAVLRQRSGNRNLVALLQGVTSPTLAHQAVGAAEFQFPVVYRSVLFLDVDVEPRVRIHPLDLGYRPGKRHGLGRIIFSGK